MLWPKVSADRNWVDNKDKINVINIAELCIKRWLSMNVFGEHYACYFIDYSMFLYHVASACR